MANAENPYLERQKLMNDRCFEVGLDEGMQIILDLLDVVLNDKNVMGKNVYGSTRLKKLRSEIDARYSHFAPAWGDGMECETKQKELDEVLKSIYGEAFNTFHERYPYCKVIDYSKPHKDLKKKPYTKAKKKGKRKRR